MNSESNNKGIKALEIFSRIIALLDSICWKYWARALERLLTSNSKPFAYGPSDATLSIHEDIQSDPETQLEKVLCECEERYPGCMALKDTMVVLRGNYNVETGTKTHLFIIGNSAELFGKTSTDSKETCSLDILERHNLELCTAADIPRILLSDYGHLDLRIMTGPLMGHAGLVYLPSIIHYGTEHKDAGSCKVLMTQCNFGSTGWESGCKYVFRIKDQVE